MTVGPVNKSVLDGIDIVLGRSKITGTAERAAALLELIRAARIMLATEKSTLSTKIQPALRPMSSVVKARIEAKTRTARAVRTLFDSVMFEGRPVGEIHLSEIPAYQRSGRFQNALGRLIRNHGSAASGDPKVRHHLTLDQFTRYVEAATEESNNDAEHGRRCLFTAKKNPSRKSRSSGARL